MAARFQSRRALDGIGSAVAVFVSAVAVAIAVVIVLLLFFRGSTHTAQNKDCANGVNDEVQDAMHTSRNTFDAMMPSQALRKLLRTGGTLYINLAHRTDRRAEVEQELSALDLPFERLDATCDKHCPSRGCAQSHVRALRAAFAKGWDTVFVLEDDFMRRVAADTLIVLEAQLASLAAIDQTGSRPSWDVLLLSGNNAKPFSQHTDGVLQVQNCQTTGAYIVRRHYMLALADFFEASVLAFARDCTAQTIECYSIDQAWKTLQRQDTWLLLSPPLGIQRPSFSDIDRKSVDYSKIMLQTHKPSH